jgi:Rieske Fe-S protein
MQLQETGPAGSRRDFVRMLAFGGAVSVVSGVPWKGTAVAAVAPAAAASGTGILRLRLADFAPLNSAFGSVRLSFTALNVLGPMPPFIVTKDGSRFYCLSAECTHAACNIPAFVSSQGKTSTCGCHGSRFAVDGSVIRGPATLPLTSYPVELVEEGVLAVELLDLPSYDLSVQQVNSGVGGAGRVAITFEALRNVEYQVLAGPSVGEALQPRSFATSATGPLNQTLFKGAGTAATLYVEPNGPAGILTVSARVRTV